MNFQNEPKKNSFLTIVEFVAGIIIFGYGIFVALTIIKNQKMGLAITWILLMGTILFLMNILKEKIITSALPLFHKQAFHSHLALSLKS